MKLSYRKAISASGGGPVAPPALSCTAAAQAQLFTFLTRNEPGSSSV